MFKRKRVWIRLLILALVIATGCANVLSQAPEQSASNHLNAREELEILKQLWGKDISEAEYIQKLDPEALRRMPEEEIRYAEVTKVDWSAIAECAITADFGKAPEGQLLTFIINEEQMETVRQLLGQDISLGELFEQVFPDILEQMPADQVERLYHNNMCCKIFESPDADVHLKSVKLTVDIGPWHIAEPKYDTFTRMIAMKLKMLHWMLEPGKQQLEIMNELLGKDISVAELLKQVYPEVLEDMPKGLLDCLYSIKVDWLSPPLPSTPPPSQPPSEPSTSSHQGCAKSAASIGFEGGPNITFDLSWTRQPEN